MRSTSRNMSVCLRVIILISFVLFFESVIGEIHRAKPTWSKNVAGANHHHHQHHHHHNHHLFNHQHHKSHHHLKHPSGSNNVAPKASVFSSSSKTDVGRSRKEDEEDSFSESDKSLWMSQTSRTGQDGHRHFGGDDERTIVGMGTSASFLSNKGRDNNDEDDRGGGDDDGGGGGGGSIADRIHQQPKDINTWIFTLLSASFVGLSGVLPLVLIPLEAGKSLREGEGYNQLKLFLSFAVGGLLGDVFLHLLPEAWNHVNTSEDFMWIGKWVLAGILSFLFIEKVMGEEIKELEENDKSEKVTKCCTEESLKEFSLSECHRNPDSSNSLGGHCCHSLIQRKSKISHGSKQNNSSLVSKENEFKTRKSSQSQNQKKKENIKISGYLNLFANCVDNFTHGLAIAGSYLVSRKVGIITTIAILLHEIPHEVGDFAILLRAGFDRWKAAKAQLLTATGGLLGAFTALTAESAEEAGIKTAWILPFTAGGFIYIALVTIVPELVKEDKPRQSLNQIVCICAGIFCMLLVTLVFE